MKRYVAALRRAAEVVDVPGVPLTLRIDQVQQGRSDLTVTWSLEDPEVWPGDSRRRRLQGTATFPLPSRRHDADTAARAWWADVQLAAARRFKGQVDADSTPGTAPRAQLWSTEEAWRALLSYLGGTGARVTETGTDVRVVHPSGETEVYRFTPEEWADYLNRPIRSASSQGDGYVVPSAVPVVGGIPVWAGDELDEAVGAHGPVAVIRHGRIVGIGEG